MLPLSSIEETINQIVPAGILDFSPCPVTKFDVPCNLARNLTREGFCLSLRRLAFHAQLYTLAGYPTLYGGISLPIAYAGISHRIPECNCPEMLADELDGQFNPLRGLFNHYERGSPDHVLASRFGALYGCLGCNWANFNVPFSVELTLINPPPALLYFDKDKDERCTTPSGGWINPHHAYFKFTLLSWRRATRALK
jgi:hypothetical protein